MSENNWSTTEQKIAETAFKKAYERETTALIQHIIQTVQEIKDIELVWNLHDYLSAKRHQIDGKYDFRFPLLIFIFSDLMKEGWLFPEDLEGLDPDKVSKITVLSRM